MPADPSVHQEKFRLGPISVVRSIGNSRYVAGNFRVERRFAQGYGFTATYVLSRFKALNGDGLGLGAGQSSHLDLRLRRAARRPVCSAVRVLKVSDRSGGGLWQPASGTLSTSSRAGGGQRRSRFRRQLCSQRFVDVGVAGAITVVLPSGERYHGAITEIEAARFELAEVDQQQKVSLRYDEVKKDGRASITCAVAFDQGSRA